jgi:hypothetical protein
MRQEKKQRPKFSTKDASANHLDLEIMPPETAEDYLLLAVEKSDVAEIVRLLRDWHGSKEIRRALNSLHHRDPVDRFTHIRRHAVELYATMHNITPANLMVSLTGVNGRKDAAGSERAKLRYAREYVNKNNDALIAARALAKSWEEDCPVGLEPDSHLKKLHRKNSILS